MPRKALLVKAAKKPKYKTRKITRCWRCGRKRGFMKEFGICRICFREMASNGQIPGVKKASW